MRNQSDLDSRDRKLKPLSSGWLPMVDLLDIDSQTNDTVIWLATNAIGRRIVDVVQGVESTEGRQEELEPEEALPKHLRPIPLSAGYPASRSASFKKPVEELQARKKQRARNSRKPVQQHEESMKHIKLEESITLRNQHEESMKHVGQLARQEELTEHAVDRTNNRKNELHWQATSGWIPRAQAPSSTSRTGSDSSLPYQGSNGARARKQFSRASQHPKPAPQVRSLGPEYDNQGAHGTASESQAQAFSENYRAQTADNAAHKYRPNNKRQFAQYTEPSQRSSNQSWWS